MFKKGVITDEISQDFRKAVELALKYKLDCVEIRSIWEKNPHELNDKEISEIKLILNDTNLQVSAISSPFYKCNLEDQNEIKSHIEILKKSMELANKLGTKLIRGFTFWNEGGFDKKFTEVLSKFEEPVKLLEKSGIRLVLEADPKVYASNGGKLKRIVEGLGVPCVKILWDPGNDIYDPDCETPFPDGYNLVKPYMVHMHLKDAKKNSDGKVTGAPIGEGDVGYTAHFRELIKDGYEGYVVLETHYRPKHDICEELLALPKGSAFSHLGYEATEECLIKWDELLESIV